MDRVLILNKYSYCCCLLVWFK